MPGIEPATSLLVDTLTPMRHYCYKTTKTSVCDSYILITQPDGLLGRINDNIFVYSYKGFTTLNFIVWRHVHDDIKFRGFHYQTFPFAQYQTAEVNFNYDLHSWSYFRCYIALQVINLTGHNQFIRYCYLCYCVNGSYFNIL